MFANLKTISIEEALSYERTSLVDVLYFFWRQIFTLSLFEDMFLSVYYLQSSIL